MAATPPNTSPSFRSWTTEQLKLSLKNTYFTSHITCAYFPSYFLEEVKHQTNHSHINPSACMEWWWTSSPRFLNLFSFVMYNCRGQRSKIYFDLFTCLLTQTAKLLTDRRACSKTRSRERTVSFEPVNLTFHDIYVNWIFQKELITFHSVT